jgi:hypothetical protein
LTVYALFGDDVRLGAFDKKADPYFYAASLVALVLFLLEMILNWAADSDYRFGFYFLLDFIATLSLVPDIEWIWRLILEQDSTLSDELAEAGSSVRAGTRASGRIVRIIRLVRMLRILKLLKVWEKSRRRRDTDERKKESEGESADEIRDTDDEPSKVGKQMSEMTTRKVIMLVLLLIVILPYFDGGIEEKVEHYQVLGLEQLHRLPQDYNHSGGIARRSFYSAFHNFVANVKSSSSEHIFGDGSEDWGGHGVVLVSLR